MIDTVNQRWGGSCEGLSTLLGRHVCTAPAVKVECPAVRHMKIRLAHLPSNANIRIASQQCESTAIYTLGLMTHIAFMSRAEEVGGASFGFLERLPIETDGMKDLSMARRRSAFAASRSCSGDSLSDVLRIAL
jgi:hypothetical protein